MSLLYSQTRQKFEERFGIRPLVVRAPGRINLIGEHVDYNDGFVMPAAIDREIVLALAASTDGRTVIHAEDVAETVDVDLNHIRRKESGGWANYLLGIIDRFMARGTQLAPFRCLFTGNIPVGSGLSSSAALECGFAYGLRALHAVDIPDLELIRMAQWSEHHYAGVKCGIMDQFASVMGKKNQVLLLDCRDLSYKHIPFVPRDFKVVLFDSKVKHSLASTEYNTRRSECEEGVRILQRTNAAISSLRDVAQEEVLARQGEFPGDVFKRMLYVTGEIARVQAAAADLARNDLAAFGKKMTETHQGLSRLYQVSCRELDFLVEQVTADTDVGGARMMGGGFGGCVIALVRPAAFNAIADRLSDAYRHAFDRDLGVYDVNIADGAAMVRS